ncbi:MAG: DUF2812 domain-containing protein [Oscillospiraceae bacterium]|nr:DUF2812 domain-containing protein [Oscillospiraceae bacterium]
MKDRIWRLPPCPPYDVESTESWLSDMAAQGWKLEPDDFFFGIASFLKTDPAPVRYRLEASPKKVSAWDDDGGVPDREAWELNTDYGWEYAGRRGQFFIYRTADAEVRELHTDPQVQALAIKAVEKRRLQDILLLAAFWLLQILTHFWRGSSFLLFAVKAGLPTVLLLAALFLGVLAFGIGEIRYLQGLKRRLKEGAPPDHRKDWKKTRRRWFGSRVLFYVLFILLIVLLLRLLGIELEHRDRMPRSEYPGKPPFATLADFAEGEYRELRNGMLDAYAVRWSNVFLKEGVEWFEHGEIRRPDGSVLSGGLRIAYYDARSEALAKLLAKELQRVDRASDRKDYEELASPDLGMDDTAAYHALAHFPCVVLRKGNIVLRALFYQTGNDTVILEEWAGILADSLG